MKFIFPFSLYVYTFSPLTIVLYEALYTLMQSQDWKQKFANVPTFTANHLYFVSDATRQMLHLAGTRHEIKSNIQSVQAVLRFPVHSIPWRILLEKIHAQNLQLVIPTDLPSPVTTHLALK